MPKNLYKVFPTCLQNFSISIDILKISKNGSIFWKYRCISIRIDIFDTTTTKAGNTQEAEANEGTPRFPRLALPRTIKCLSIFVRRGISIYTAHEERHSSGLSHFSQEYTQADWGVVRYPRLTLPRTKKCLPVSARRGMSIRTAHKKGHSSDLPQFDLLTTDG